MANPGVWSHAISTYVIFNKEISRYISVGNPLRFFTDGTVTAVNGRTATVKLVNGTEIKAKLGLWDVHVSAWVLILKNFRQAGYREHRPNYEVSSYEIIGVRYITEEGRVTKTYRV